MVNTLTNIIKTPFVTYDPSEFMPIYRNGKLDNKAEFIGHKIKAPVKNYIGYVLEG